ncbi:MAG TPA: hypothetical protein VHG30_03305 [Microvirga sp.]|nr:hypothetical protein [Microvirga sp.]
MARPALQTLVALALFALHVVGCPASVHAQSSLNPGFAAGETQLSPEARAGREIWFFATAGNERFLTYSYPQRIGVAIDWYKVLAAKNKGDLFQAWGVIPDPDCCVPGQPDCPAKSLEETFGFQWCPGDTELLKFVGKLKVENQTYRDPACDFNDAPFKTDTPHGPNDQRQNPCDLKFGTSTGALGLRKFPNPRFDAEKWRQVNGSLASWEGLNRPLSADPNDSDSRTTRLFDGSVEPPFLIGMSCGACHISHDPLKKVADINRPKWDEIDGLVGGQYSRISQLLASGMSRHSVEWQLIARARPGTVDTSALPMDTVANPGTMNPVYNFAQRPLHDHRVLKWRRAAACPSGPNANCWCEPDRPGKCWLRSELRERVQHILKGGEDSIGAEEAIQRVYFNIGSCAEQCWLNHIPDLRATDPAQRNYGQTPFDIGQCRRDCASFRAIEDRLPDLAAFFLTARPTDLWKARGLSGPDELDRQLDEEFGPGSVALGRQIFTRTCAGCHSSQSGLQDRVDYRATVPGDPTLRIDFLSHERPVLASRIGTYLGRAMHSNHMASRVWDQYAARDLHDQPVDPTLKEVMKGGGRGYYRPPSLLSVWAQAPFMHNNAIGPEVCGKPSNAAVDFYSSPYVDANERRLPDAPACVPYDASVEGRYKLFKASMEDLLNPSRRIPKINLVDEDIIVDIAPKVQILGREGGLSLKLPKGYPVGLLSNLRYKDLIQDVILSRRDPQKLQAKYADLLTVGRFKELESGLQRLHAQLDAQKDHFTLDLSQEQRDFIQSYYSNVLGRVENSGHRFGEDLSEREKQALIAFLATL